MKKWISKQCAAFSLGFLESLMEYRETPDEVLAALKIVIHYINVKYFH